MKVLITGGTGFVGAWTAKAVQDNGHDVRFLVRSVERLKDSAGSIGVNVDDHVARRHLRRRVRRGRARRM